MSLHVNDALPGSPWPIAFGRHGSLGSRVWSAGEVAGEIADVPQYLIDTFFHDRGSFEAVAVAHSPTEASYHRALLSWAERANRGEVVGDPPVHFHVGVPPSLAADDPSLPATAGPTVDSATADSLTRAWLDAGLDAAGVPLAVRQAFFEMPETLHRALATHPDGNHAQWWDALTTYERGSALLEGARRLPESAVGALLSGDGAALEAAIQWLPEAQHLGVRQQVAEIVAQDQRLALGRSLAIGMPESVRKAFVAGDGFALANALASLPADQAQAMADATYAASVTAALVGAAWLAPASSRAAIASGDASALAALTDAIRQTVESTVRVLTLTPLAGASGAGDLRWRLPDAEGVVRLIEDLHPALFKTYGDDPRQFHAVVDRWSVPLDEAMEAWRTLALVERADDWNHGADAIERRWGRELADALRTGDEAALDAALATKPRGALEDLSERFARDRRTSLVQRMEVPPEVRAAFINGDVEKVKCWVRGLPTDQQPGMMEQMLRASLQAAYFGAAPRVPGPARAAFLAGDIPGAHRQLPLDVPPSVVDDALAWAMTMGNPQIVDELGESFFTIGGHFDRDTIGGADGGEATTFVLRGDITGTVTLDGGSVNGEANEVVLDASATWVAEPEMASHRSSFRIFRLNDSGQIVAEAQLMHIRGLALSGDASTMRASSDGFDVFGFIEDVVLGAVPIVMPAPAPFIAMMPATDTALGSGGVFDIVGRRRIGVAGSPVLTRVGGLVRGEVLPALMQLARVLPDPVPSFVGGGAARIQRRVHGDLFDASFDASNRVPGPRATVVDGGEALADLPF